jgi:hypothetical protein
MRWARDDAICVARLTRACGSSASSGSPARALAVTEAAISIAAACASER